MNIAELHAKTVRLELELQETRDLLARATHDPEATTAELARTRPYAFAVADQPDHTVAGCADSLSRYGFCVIENVIPASEVDVVREEIVAADAIVSRNSQAIKDLSDLKGLEGEDLLKQAAGNNVELRPVRRVGHPPQPPNDIVWMPEYARHLANPVVTAVARRVLDDHLRIAQLHTRIIATDESDGTRGGFGAVEHRGRADSRRWHTDWPHDLSAYGADDPNRNAGCIRQPFPDVTMCLVMIWYLTDVDEDSGGTWVVPGSHRDPRNPRGPEDDIIVSAPIPGDMQINAPAGSVYIQDSRSWHATAAHNPSGRARVAVVNRWCPWWVSVDDFAPGEKYNASTICRPLSRTEYLDLPADLQPLLRHCCPEERDTLQQPVLDRAAAAGQRTRLGFQKLTENADDLVQANAHIRVPLDLP
jgi:ectoine hydroxylase-related dioxygenase (phytanoyl-CoA dioxygenase family)